MMFGFELIRNFNAPYHADSITDFWRRWHISLSTWLREYLYISLGGNRKGETRTYINLALVMLLGGFWHGSQWQFIVWGAIHGTMLGIERWSGKRPFYANSPRQVRVAVTFIVVLITWVFFRADGLPHAFSYLGSMFGAGTPAAFSDLLKAEIYSKSDMLNMVICAIAVAQPIQSYEFGIKLSWGRAAVVFTLFLMAVVMMYTQAFNPFLYFQF
jgi:alginate O-acetyltransferase complex protein AlgI